MKRSFVIIILFCLAAQISEAQLWKQRRYEVAIGAGPSMFFGDIGGFSKKENILGFKDISFLQTRFDVNLNLKYRILEDVNLRLSLAYGMLHATDDRGSNESRGFEAKTTVFEPSLLGEYYLIKNKMENSYIFTTGRNRFSFKDLITSLDIYAFTGIAGLSYNITPNDKLIVLTKSGFAAVIPVGVGLDILFSPDFNFGIDFGGRYAFSDNIDGYTSNKSTSNDVYYFFNFTFTYKIKTGKNGLPAFLTSRRR
jgi:hypothetical protein